MKTYRERVFTTDRGIFVAVLLEGGTEDVRDRILAHVEQLIRRDIETIVPPPPAPPQRKKGCGCGDP
jgi:hypothetical protein